MWRLTTDRKGHDDRLPMRGSSDDPWVMGILEPVLLLLALAIIAVVVL